MSDTPMSLRQGTIAFMIRTSIIVPKEAALIAVSALDDLVMDLVKASPLKLSAKFLDWVADEATPLVEAHVSRSFCQPGFAATLRVGDHRIALSRWVRHWICPGIAARFEQLAPHVQAMSFESPMLGITLPSSQPIPTLARDTVTHVRPSMAARPQRGQLSPGAVQAA